MWCVDQSEKTNGVLGCQIVTQKTAKMFIIKHFLVTGYGLYVHNNY